MATIADVARLAGVAPITVSRVLNGNGPVNPATRARVLAAIQELDYVPNAIARSLARNSTSTLAYFQSNITNPFNATVLRGIEQVAHEAGFSVFLCDIARDTEAPGGEAANAPWRERAVRYFETLVSRRVDGVIVNSEAVEPYCRLLERAGIPYVAVVHELEGLAVDTVVGDNVGGARQLVHHLASLGHRRIAFFNGQLSTSTARERLAGYQAAVAEAGLDDDLALIWPGEYSRRSGYERARALLERPAGVTAVFAANNFIALGVLAALRERGWRCPEDLALVSFDDIELAALIDPFLTVVVERAEEMGARATSLLLERIAGATPAGPRRVVLPVDLIVRRSCGAALPRAAGEGGGSGAGHEGRAGTR